MRIVWLRPIGSTGFVVERLRKRYEWCNFLDLNKDNVNSCLRAGQRPGKYSSARGGATRKSIRTSVRERSVWLRPIAVLH